MTNSFFETNKHGFQENKHYLNLQPPESLTESLQQTFNKLSGQ